MNDQIPNATIQALARSVFKEASSYGFGQVDIIRLVNELLECCGSHDHLCEDKPDSRKEPGGLAGDFSSLPITSERLVVRPFDVDADIALLNTWLPDKYGRYFVLSSSAAQSLSVEELVHGHRNHLGIITTLEQRPVGALAFLDYDAEQKRAELRKLIGDPDYRGKGLAEEATRMWIEYGINALQLEKIYVSTLQTHIGNIKLNEEIGFQIEGLLRDEVLIDGTRHDVLRMGYCRD